MQIFLHSMKYIHCNKYSKIEFMQIFLKHKFAIFFAMKMQRSKH